MLQHLQLVLLQILLIQLIGFTAEISYDSDDEYLKVTRRALNEFNGASNDAYWWKPIRILDAHTTLNIGLRYTIHAVIARTNCTKNALKRALVAIEECEVNVDSKQQACIFEISQLHWKIPEKISFLGCSEHNHSPNVNKSRGLPVVDNQIEFEEAAEKTSDSTVGGALEKFQNFIERFKRVYASVEERMERYRIFKKNLRIALKIQSEEKGSAIYGATKYSDMTPEEFKNKMLPLVWPTLRSFGNNFNFEEHNLKFDDLPESFDWRKKGMVTPVKNQGSCGSCWAFSVTGNIEGLWAIKTGNLISLSEQELVDCDVIDKGCNGGLPINAFKEIVRMGGLMDEEDYPYLAHKSTCHLKLRNVTVYINDSVEIPRNETVMQAWIAQKGPLSVGIDADLLMFYRGGILHPPRRLCPPSRIDHGVLVVGYGSENGMPYWLIKNSWGRNWGEQGYFRMLRGKDICGIQDLVSSAIIY